MKIVEEVEIVNADKVFMGKEQIKLTLDTETRRVSIDAPAMFTDPVATIDKLEEVITKLKGYADKAREGG
jgi:hypothetical protein